MPPGLLSIPEGTVCDNCGQRPAKHAWVGDGGSLALSHGLWKPWCWLCVLRAQLEHAREQAARIPHLEAEIAKEEAK